MAVLGIWFEPPYIPDRPSLDRDAHLSQLKLPRVALLRGSSSSLLLRSMRRKRGQQFICCYGCVGVQDTINARGLHALKIERGRCILDEGDVETQFHAEARCPLHAGVGDKADGNDLLNAVLLELHFEVCARKPFCAQCSRTTTSPGLGPNSGCHSPPHFPFAFSFWDRHNNGKPTNTVPAQKTSPILGAALSAVDR